MGEVLPEEPRIEECHACEDRPGINNGQVMYHFAGVQVVCTHCHMRGPAHVGRVGAITAWNRIQASIRVGKQRAGAYYVDPRPLGELGK